MAELLKERFFTEQFIDELAAVIQTNSAGFDRRKFKSLVYGDSWEAKELKERMRHISLSLGQTLPEDYDEAISILRKTAPHFTGFDGMVFPDFVEVFGLAHWETSLAALEFFTQFSSSEFAIRPFLKENSADIFPRMEKWAAHKNHHVRRLASEGCRPRLPWAMAIPELKKTPAPILPILEMLKADESDYVRRSVANNLNDISKDHPGLVLEICERWHGSHKHTNWIVKHACRGLLKNGNSRAMIIFGFGNPKNVEIKNFTLDKPTVAIGGEFTFEFDVQLKSKPAAKLRIEYAIYFRKAKGNLSKKVFQISENTFREAVTHFSKKHSFKDLTTRKHHPGEHQISVIVNGIEKAKTMFEVIRKS